MLNDFIVCPECHKRLEPELVRCKYCYAYVHDTSPWRKDNILLVTALTFAILFVLFLFSLLHGRLGVAIPGYELMGKIFGDNISKLILALGIYGMLLLIFKNRITGRQQRTFQVVRKYCAEHTQLTEETLAEVRHQVHGQGLGSYNTLLAYTRLQWLVETACAPQREREARINAMREHGQTDWDALESSFASSQFLVWLLPSLGFLGTVWGMTQALVAFSSTVNSSSGNLSFQNSLSETAEGLGIAFHTTLVGLALVIPVLLLATASRRRAQLFLERLDKFFIRMSTQVFAADLAEAQEPPPIPAEMPDIEPAVALADAPITPVIAESAPAGPEHAEPETVVEEATAPEVPATAPSGDDEYISEDKSNEHVEKQDDLQEELR